ncbi:MAG: hypothetical protein ACE5IY_04095 [bacterium]
MQIRRIKKGLRNLPNLVKGYNIYVNRDKLELIKLAFGKIRPGTSSFADLGGVWRVNAAYAIFALKTFVIQKAFIVDSTAPGASCYSALPHERIYI